jgi:hypothetical protein
MTGSRDPGQGQNAERGHGSGQAAEPGTADAVSAAVPRRTFLGLAATTSAAVASQRLRVPTRSRARRATVRDSYSSEVTFRTRNGFYGAPIHSTLMPDGRLFLMGYKRDTAHPTLQTQTQPLSWVMPAPVHSPIKPTFYLRPMREPLLYTNYVTATQYKNDDLFCSGHALLASGAFFSAGGTRNIRTEPGKELVAVTGLPYATLFDGHIFTRLQSEMVGRGATDVPNRWYPTVTRLPDTRMLVVSGFDIVIPTPRVNRSAEAFDPSTGTFSLLAAYPQLPGVVMASDYTHVFVIPFKTPADVIMFGEPGIPVLYSIDGSPKFAPEAAVPRPNTAAWQAQRVKDGGIWNADTAPGQGATTAMLPIFPRSGGDYHPGSISLFGGPIGSTWSSSFDVFDIKAQHWRETVHTQVARSNAAQVMLPDGQIALINGHGPDPQIGKVELVDTMNGFTTTVGHADSHQQRGYHNVATLLPDGSVFVGGGRARDTPDSFEKPTFRYWYPPYMTANRPSILQAPRSFRHDRGVVIDYEGAVEPGGVVLIALGSMTHAVDMNQRVIQLEVSHIRRETGQRYSVHVLSPVTTRIAPAGYYMLFAVDRDRIPSTAVIVQLV